MTKTELCLFYVTDGWKKHEVAEETGCNFAQSGIIWSEILRVRAIARDDGFPNLEDAKPEDC